jgi:hypothetical protein
MIARSHNSGALPLQIVLCCQCRVIDPPPPTHLFFNCMSALFPSILFFWDVTTLEVTKLFGAPKKKLFDSILG